LAPRNYTSFIIFTEFLIGFLLLVVGGYVFSESTALLYLEIDYTGLCPVGGHCRLPSVQIDRPVAPPIFLQYKVSGFYQNSFDYFRTLPIPHDNLGHSPTADSNCAGFQTNEQVGAVLAVDGSVLSPSETASPCGMASFYYFNDTFGLYLTSGDVHFDIKKSGIAWPSDVKERFHNYNLSEQWMDFDSEAYTNWIRVSPFGSFVKTAAKIDTILPQGTYEPSVSVNWNSSLFNCTTALIIAETAFFGTRNIFLGIVVALVGLLGIAAGFFTAADEFRRNSLRTKFD
jgi:hypothetical protein